MSRTRCGTRSPAVTALLLTAALGGCSTVERGCTAIGAESGLDITVESALVAGFGDLVFEVCQRSVCTTHPVPSLMPGSVSVDQGCSGTAPGDSCSASASPDGSLVAFVPVAELVAGEVAVSASYSLGGTARTSGPITLRANAVRPNGPGCEPEVAQVALRLGGTGLS